MFRWNYSAFLKSFLVTLICGGLVITSIDYLEFAEQRDKMFDDAMTAFIFVSDESELAEVKKRLKQRFEDEIRPKWSEYKGDYDRADSRFAKEVVTLRRDMCKNKELTNCPNFDKYYEMHGQNLRWR